MAFKWLWWCYSHHCKHRRDYVLLFPFSVFFCCFALVTGTAMLKRFKMRFTVRKKSKKDFTYEEKMRWLGVKLWCNNILLSNMLLLLFSASAGSKRKVLCTWFHLLLCKKYCMMTCWYQGFSMHLGFPPQVAVLWKRGSKKTNIRLKFTYNLMCKFERFRFKVKSSQFWEKYGVNRKYKCFRVDWEEIHL